MVKTVIKGNNSCALCRTTWKDECVKFFKVPKNDARRLLWIECCGVELKHSARLCQKHFSQSDFINAPGDALAKRSRLMPNAVPKLLCTTKRSEPNLVETLEIIPLGTKICSSTQTDDKFSRSIKVAKLKHQVQLLEVKVADLEKQCQELDYTKNLKAIFTMGQIRKMRTTNKNHIHWSLEDISAAMSLYTIGARAYRHLYQKGFPYPCEDTLQKWRRKIKLINSSPTQ